MADPAKKLDIKTDARTHMPPAPQSWHPFENLRREVGRLFDDFDRDFSPSRFRRSLLDLEPFRQLEAALHLGSPAVDVTETDKAFEIKVDLPGMSEKDIEVRAANGGLTIQGEKRDEREEKQKDYYVRERRYGAFERSFRLPESIDKDKIEADFKNGVLTVVLPKTAEAQKEAKKIEIRAR
jgi:HSP20 family protein